MKRTLRIGTRRSPLALWQAEHVREKLEASHAGLHCDIVRIVTKGDKILDVPLADIGGKGLFIKEIEEALLKGDIDLAVHSLKDMPHELPRGLILGALPHREDPRDVLVARAGIVALDGLPRGARIGTSSLRRKAQLKRYRDDLEIVSLRGNVGTRLMKVDQGDLDAVVLALAGITRLGESHRISQILDPHVCLPAIGQGVLGIEVRQDDVQVRELLHPLHDPATACAATAERTFLATLQGGCQVPVGGLAVITGATLSLTGMVASLDGSELLRMSISGHTDSAEHLGRELGHMLLNEGADRLLRDIYGDGTH